VEAATGVAGAEAAEINSLNASVINQLPALGAGIGYRDQFRTELFLNRSSVDFLEIVADHFLDPTPEKSNELDLLSGHFTLIPHGINLSIGSAEGVDMHYVEQLAQLVDRVKPPWWSEHIAFTKAGGIDIGHLTPMPFTRESVKTLCRNIFQVQRVIDRPFILENISYIVHLPGAEMTEPEFLSEVIERTGCGLLLDVTNLHINSINFKYDPIKFLDSIPVERIVQLHFVGGKWAGDVYVDTHSEPTPEEIWDLLDEVVRRAPVRGILLERDENIPPFAELAAEVARARTVGKRHQRWD
jgi:uncharacterized protein (UPF0276 family)